MLEVFVVKNFFLVINKEKIYAYVVSILTIITLFFMSGMIGNSQFDETESTSSNIVENSVEDNEIDNSMYNN